MAPEHHTQPLKEPLVMATRPIMNPVRPGGGIGVGGTKPTTAPRLPTAKTLKNVLGTYKFHSPGKEIPLEGQEAGRRGAGLGAVAEGAEGSPG